MRADEGRPALTRKEAGHAGAGAKAKADRRRAAVRRRQGSATAATKGKKLKEDMDRLVDEIDDVLEENAEEFVKSYVQRGGE